MAKPPAGGERGINAGPVTLNHMVQYVTQGLPACKWRPAACNAGDDRSSDFTNSFGGGGGGFRR
jgi:hypothetical protein